MLDSCLLFAHLESAVKTSIAIASQKPTYGGLPFLPLLRRLKRGRSVPMIRCARQSGTRSLHANRERIDLHEARAVAFKQLLRPNPSAHGEGIT